MNVVIHQVMLKVVNIMLISPWTNVLASRAHVHVYVNQKLLTRKYSKDIKYMAYNEKRKIYFYFSS